MIGRPKISRWPKWSERLRDTGRRSGRAWKSWRIHSWRVKFSDRRIAGGGEAGSDEENGGRGGEGWRKGGGMNGHEILLAVHGMRNSGGRSCRRVDQGEVAPLFSV